jgi:hypothetical protein
MKKTVLEGKYEDVIQFKEHYFILDKKDRVCVLPYTLSTNSLLDKIGVIRGWNKLEDEETYMLLNDYISEDDETDLVAANRILFEVTGTNIKEAGLWMYLGNLYNNMTTNSPVKVYAVNITDIEIKTDENVEETEMRKKFKLLDSARAVQTDDVFFLSSFCRLLNFFFVNSLQKNNES